MTQTIEQLTTDIIKATKPLEEEVERWRNAANSVNARLAEYICENQELRAQLTKAEQLWQVAQGRCDGLEEKLASAEQRVAEAIHDMTDEVCAPLQTDDKSIDYWHGVGAAAVAIENAISNGEYRKFVKEV